MESFFPPPITTAIGRSIMAAVSWAAIRLGLMLGYPLRASWFGAGPTKTATENRDAIQAMVDAVAANGKAHRMVIDEPGTYLVAGGTVGYVLTEKGCIVLSALPPGSEFEVAAGVVLKLPDNSMSGTVTWYTMFIGDAANLNIYLHGEGTIDMNSINQPSWVGPNATPYTQLAGSKAACFSCEVGAFERCHIKGLTIKNTFANSTLMQGRADAAVFGGMAINEELKCTNFGEGPEIDVVKRSYAIRNELVFNDNVAGDFLEQVNCDQGYWFGNRVRHINGTNPPTSGACVDCGGTLVAYLRDNVFEDARGMFEATTTNTVTGFPNRRNQYTYVDGMIVRNCPGGAIFPGEGESDWFGVDVATTVLAFNCRSLTPSYATSQHHRFHNARVVGGSFMLFDGQLKASFYGCQFSGAGNSFQARRSDTMEGIPTGYISGGSYTTTSSSCFYFDATGYNGVFNPRMILTDWVAFSSNAATGHVGTVGSLADASNIIYERAAIDTTVAYQSGVIGTVRLSGSFAGDGRLYKIPLHKRLIGKARIRVVDASGVSGNVTLSIGTVAGSYIDVSPSTAYTLATVGQWVDAAVATGAAPVGAGTGTDVYVHVTAGAVGYLVLQVDFYGDTIPVPVVDSPTNISNFRTRYRHPFFCFTDIAGTTPATVVGDDVGCFKKQLGTGPDFVATSNPTRVVFGANGIKGNAAGFLRATLSLLGPYTIVLRIKTANTNEALGYFGTWMGATGYMIRNLTGPAKFYHNADAAETDFGATANAKNVIGIAVTNTGTTTLFKADGTAVSGDGSSGGTDRSATTTVDLLSGLLNSIPASANMELEIMDVFDKVLTTAEFLREKAMIEAL